MKKILSLTLSIIIAVSFPLTSLFAEETSGTTTDTSATTQVQSTTNDSSVVPSTADTTAVTSSGEQSGNIVSKEPTDGVKINDVIKSVILKDIDEATLTKLEGMKFNYLRIAQIVELANKSGKSIDEVANAFVKDKGIALVCKDIGIGMKDYVAVQKDLMVKINEAKKEAIAALKNNANDKITKNTNLTADQVQKLKDSGFNYVQIALIGYLTQKTGKTVDEVSAVVKDSKNLKEISDKLGVNLKELVKEKVTISKVKTNLENKKEKIENNLKDKVDQIKQNIKEHKEKSIEKVKNN